VGRALLAAALRAVDGFAPMTPILQSVLDERGGVDGVIAFGFTARPTDFAGYARRLVGSDDPAAAALMQQAQSEIAASIALLQPARVLPVVFLGSLGLAIAPQFANRWDIRAALGSGLDGALWLALHEECPA
jgi:glucosamine kinase